MSKDKPGAGWGTDCEAQLEYDFNDNYYLLIWDDPNFMEVRNTKQVIAALAVSMAEDECNWWMHNKVPNGGGKSTRDIKELMDWLNVEQDGPDEFDATLEKLRPRYSVHRACPERKSVNPRFKKFNERVVTLLHEYPEILCEEQK